MEEKMDDEITTVESNGTKYPISDPKTIVEIEHNLDYIKQKTTYRPAQIDNRLWELYEKVNLLSVTVSKIVDVIKSNKRKDGRRSRNKKRKSKKK